MGASTKRETSVKKRRRVKVSDIEKTVKNLHANELKKVRGGAIAKENSKLEKNIKGSVVNIN